MPRSDCSALHGVNKHSINSQTSFGVYGINFNYRQQKKKMKTYEEPSILHE